MGVGNVYEQVSALLEEYLEPLGMNRPAGPLRAVGDLTRSIVWTGSVQLSNAARLLAQTPNDLEHAVKRSSRHLSNRRWDHRAWAAAILAEQTRHLADDDLIPIDATELAKPYARCLQYQCTVRDASRPADPLVSGYWCWGAYHWQPVANSLSPLMLRAYSPNQPAFRSENDSWNQFCWTLRQATSGKGIWLSDRGGDRPEVLSLWLRIQPRWIIRLREDRALIGPDRTIRPAGEWADWALAYRPTRGRAVTLPVRLPPQHVRQAEMPPSLWLVVPTYRFGSQDRWVLLTRGLIDQHVGPRQVRHEYACRWHSEDAKRLLGQVWHVERFLTRSFVALERTLWCVTAAGGFLASLQRDRPQLAQQLHEEVIYWHKPAIIPGYRLAHGLVSLAAQHGHATIPNNA